MYSIQRRSVISGVYRPVPERTPVRGRDCAGLRFRSSAHGGVLERKTSAPDNGFLLAAILLSLALPAIGAAAPQAEPASAVPAPATRPPLTLSEALALAARNNELSGIATARIDRARALRRQAYSTLLPDLTFDATYTRRSREVTRTVDDEEITVQAIDALNGTLTVETDILDVRAFPVARSATRNLEARVRQEGPVR